MSVSFKSTKAELYWYHNRAHADLGISSNFGTIISQGCGFAQHSGNWYEDKILAISSKRNSPMKKLRKIEKALTLLSPSHKRIIEALYGEYNYPPQLISIFGEKTGAAIFNTRITDLQNLLNLCSKKLSKLQLTQLEEKYLNLIKEDADKLYNEVHNQYWIRRNETDNK